MNTTASADWIEAAGERLQALLVLHSATRNAILADKRLRDIENAEREQSRFSKAHGIAL